jgi:hypothetical protein
MMEEIQTAQKLLLKMASQVTESDTRKLEYGVSISYPPFHMSSRLNEQTGKALARVVAASSLSVSDLDKTPLWPLVYDLVVLHNEIAAMIPTNAHLEESESQIVSLLDWYKDSLDAREGVRTREGTRGVKKINHAGEREKKKMSGIYETVDNWLDSEDVVAAITLPALKKLMGESPTWRLAVMGLLNQFLARNILQKAAPSMNEVTLHSTKSLLAGAFCPWKNWRCKAKRRAWRLFSKP